MTERSLIAIEAAPEAKYLLAGEPIIAHCNFYNYWLQKTVLLTEPKVMAEVCRRAAAAEAYHLVSSYPGNPAARLKLAADSFSEQGFGTLDFSSLSETGGAVRTPTSHYGELFFGPASIERFEEPTNLFDQGYVAGAAAAAYGLPQGSFQVSKVDCHSTGGAGLIELSRCEPGEIFSAVGRGPACSVEAPPPNANTSVDEAAILTALAGLDYSGNEEGFVPRFGVMLSFHYANYYNRISFEMLRRMADSGLGAYAQELLVEAGHICAFNTFGGIMSSAEWDAVIKPQCVSKSDWVHGMTAVVNSLGWGLWRVHELSEERLVMRIYDDYESCGYRAMYGLSKSPVSYLAVGGVAGLMNLVFTGDIASRPRLDQSFYETVYNSPTSFKAHSSKSFALGDDYTEIVAER